MYSTDIRIPGEGSTVTDGAWEDVQAATSRLMSQEGVFQLTQDLRMFSETLSNLKSVFCDDKDASEQSLRVAAHERLGELLKVLKNIVNKYTELNSTGILNAAENLISHIKNLNYEREEEIVPPEIFSAINNLALAFSSSVSECLVGDINISPRQSLVTAQSYENLPQQSVHHTQTSGPYEHAPEIFTDEITTAIDCSLAITPIATSETVADVLNQVTESLDICFERAKAWSKYANDLITYVKKRAHMELEYSKQLTKLSQTTRAALSEQSFLPFQSLYCTALDNDKEYATNLVTTYQNFILAHKFIEPLQARRQEHDKQHKLLRETWRKAKRRLEEAEVNLKKAKQQYQIRNQEYQKAKEASMRADQQTAVINDQQQNRQVSNSGINPSSILGAPSLTALPTSKVEKRKRQEDDSYLKATQAEHYYRACVNEANHRRRELERKEEQYLKTLRDLMTQCDQTTKTVTLSFFQLNCDLVSPLRVQFQALLDESKNYEPGFQYAEYLKHVTPQHTGERLDYRFEPFLTEGSAYFEPTTVSTRAEVPPPGDSSPIPGQATKLGAYSAPRKTTRNRGFSDTESSSSRSLDDISPATSPGEPPNRKDILRRRPSTEGSLSSEEILDDVPKESQDPGRLLAPQNLEIVLSSSPESSPAPPRSQFPKVMKVVRDAFKGMKRTMKPTVFGVDFSVAAQESPDGVPFIVKKCIAEIDNRALNVKGIYRVNGVKNRVEKLCSLLDSPQCIRTDISEHLPHDISGVLKYFLRQLPEPILLYRHYNQFLDIAKDYTDILNASKEQDEPHPVDERVQSTPEHEQEVSSQKLYALLDRMSVLIEKLPEANRNTLQYIVAHLSRVTEHQNVNKMTASNLAIIFGPTLLKPVHETGKELQSLIELPSQSQAIEMLITHRNKIFDTYSHQARQEDMKDTMKMYNPSESPLQQDETERNVPSLTPKTSSQSQPSTLSSASSGEVLASSENIHQLVEDSSYSASGASAMDVPSTKSSPDEATQQQTENSFSADISQNEQSNGGMNTIADGRANLPHSPGIKKSSSSLGLPEGSSQHLSGHDDLSIERSARESLGADACRIRPVSLSPGGGTSGRRPKISERKHIPEGLSPSESAEDLEPRGRKPVEEHQASRSGSVPVAPARLKSRGKRSPKTLDHLPMELTAGGVDRHYPMDASISPHRPRSRRVSDCLVSGQYESALEFKGKGVDERSRRRSMMHSSKGYNNPAEAGPRQHVEFLSSAHPTAVEKPDASRTETGAATVRRLAHIPQAKNTSSSSKPHPVSMPGRTPPFNKAKTWSFAKADIQSTEGRELQIGDLQESLAEGSEEVSFC